jgi:hypothetical protein
VLATAIPPAERVVTIEMPLLADNPTMETFSDGGVELVEDLMGRHGGLVLVDGGAQRPRDIAGELEGERRQAGRKPAAAGPAGRVVGKLGASMGTAAQRHVSAALGPRLRPRARPRRRPR